MEKIPFYKISVQSISFQKTPKKSIKTDPSLCLEIPGLGLRLLLSMVLNLDSETARRSFKKFVKSLSIILSFKDFLSTFEPLDFGIIVIPFGMVYLIILESFFNLWKSIWVKFDSSYLLYII